MNRTSAIATAALAVIAIAALIFMGAAPGRNGPASNTPKTAWLQDFAVGELAKLSVTLPPTAMPPEEFLDGEGRSVSLDAFKGKVLLINFWATWCAPCLVEMPSLNRLAADANGDDFMVLPISIDRRGAEVAKPFLDSIEADHLPLYLDPSSRLARAVHVAGLPVTLLVDHKGREIARYVGPAEWDGPEARALVAEAVRRAR